MSISTGPPPPCLLLLVLESQSLPGMEFAKRHILVFSRKNILTGEQAALGLWETPDIEKLRWSHTAFYQTYW